MSCLNEVKHTGVIAQGWMKTYTQKSIQLYKPSACSESLQLDVFRADDCFQLYSLTEKLQQNRNSCIFSLLKPILAQLRELLQTHMQWYGREQTFFFLREVDGDGEECQHLCWEYFLFL